MPIEGSASAPLVRAFQACDRDFNGADLADIAHFLCLLHGRKPGVIDHAGARSMDESARLWLQLATLGFAAERALLTRLTVAAGPISGNGNKDKCEEIVAGQRKALDTLAQSDRRGCALGAAMALCIEWEVIRPLLERIADRLSVPLFAIGLPDSDMTRQLAAELAAEPLVARAIGFGAEQIVSQHHGLWKLLESRRVLRAV
ncbi:MAG: hypothetical protein U5J78_00280 [Parasphingorhabdus sp.]|nr:hypothetical protein [Parasphingorhabdus sp.]